MLSGKKILSAVLSAALLLPAASALAEDDENWRDVRAVGALCGVNTGTLENCALTRGTNSSTSALVAAALAFGDSTTATERTAEDKTENNKNYTYTGNDS